MAFPSIRLLWALLGVPVVGWAQTENTHVRHSQSPRQYVLLSDSLGALHHVKAQRGGRQFEGILASDAGQGTPATITIPKVSVEILNLLVSAPRVRQLLAPWEGNDASYFLSGDTLLITMALLPTLTGRVTWQPVQPDTIPSGSLRSLADAVREGGKRIAAYRKAGNPGVHDLLCRDDLVPLVWRQGQYWAPSSYVLTEYFQVRHRSTQTFPATDLATVNILGRLFPKEVLLQQKRRQSGNAHAQLEGFPAGNVIQRHAGGRYEFWSNPSVTLSHPDVLHYGSGDFQYRPGVGVVSSTYKFYFQRMLDHSTQSAWDEFFDVMSIDGSVVKLK
jgi:hypothetical protein